jgi:hypothetical protein
METLVNDSYENGWRNYVTNFTVISFTEYYKRIKEITVDVACSRHAKVQNCIHFNHET